MWFWEKKRILLLFGDDYVIREIKNLEVKQGYQSEKKKDRTWPLVHTLLLPTNGGFPYATLATDYGVLDPFNILSKEERDRTGNGQVIAKEAIRSVMYKIQKDGAGNIMLLVLAFGGVAIFLIILILALLFVSGELRLR